MINHSALYHWYESSKRELPWRDTTSAYRIWLSEIILQQTRVQQGMDYWWRFVERFPQVEDLANATEDEVMLLWQGLGYYSRARNLHKAAKLIVSNGWAPFPTRFEDVIQLPGVGEYTAGAIMSFAYNAPYPAADGNVYRVLSRLMDCDEPFDTTAGKKLFRQYAWELLDREQPRLHNSAIMELGAIFCTPGQPDCPHCPLSGNCRAYASGTVSLLPVRKPRTPLKDRYLHYTIYLNPNGFTLLHQRKEKDIWHHLWEFPLAECASSEELGREDFRHVLSHQRLHARFDICRVNDLPTLPDCITIPFSSIHEYALSRLTLRFLESIEQPH